MSFFSLETGGGDYLAVLLNVELDPSLSDLVTLLIRCNLPGNRIYVRPVRCIVSLRAVHLDRSIPCPCDSFLAYFSIQAATSSQWYSTSVHAIDHIDVCTAKKVVAVAEEGANPS